MIASLVRKKSKKDVDWNLEEEGRIRVEFNLI